MIGIGDNRFSLAVYIANRPPLREYEDRSGLRAAVSGELNSIVSQTSNHWRKVFNVYAKLAFALDHRGFGTWQEYRDKCLLQKGSEQALLFGDSLLQEGRCAHILCGKTHGLSLVDEQELQWIDDCFAINQDRKIILCPYFDYRQLSNAKLEQLRTLIKPMLE